MAAISAGIFEIKVFFVKKHPLQTDSSVIFAVRAASFGIPCITSL
jgi:hypothetical protein